MVQCIPYLTRFGLLDQKSSELGIQFRSADLLLNNSSYKYRVLIFSLFLPISFPSSSISTFQKLQIRHICYYHFLDMLYPRSIEKYFEFFISLSIASLIWSSAGYRKELDVLYTRFAVLESVVQTQVALSRLDIHVEPKPNGVLENCETRLKLSSYLRDTWWSILSIRFCYLKYAGLCATIMLSFVGASRWEITNGFSGGKKPNI